MLAEAQQKRQSIVAELERTQSALNERISQLRPFEQDYRCLLYTYRRV